MPRIHASASALIPAPAHAVYAILADYHEGHPRILPRETFPTLEVEKGGVGSGTVIRYQMRVLGSTRTLRAQISEPVPGQVLLETDLDTGARTTFTVTPLEGAAMSRVQIVTEWVGRGPRGWIERLFAPPILRRIYAEELANLAEVVEQEADTLAALQRAAADAPHPGR